MTAAPQSCTLMTVERGLAVLRAFRADRTPLSNAELVRRTGLSKATVSRLTSTLMQVGFLRQVPGQRDFELAHGALGIGDAYLANNEVLQAARPPMQALADALEVSVALAVPHGLDMLYVGYCAGQSVATLRLGIGSALPMATTAIGRAYLWGLPQEPQRQLLAQHLHRAGARAQALECAILASFAELEADGTCAVLGGFQRGTYGVALPLHASRERTLMSLSCGRADVELDLQAERARVTPLLRATAQHMEALLASYDRLP